MTSHVAVILCCVILLCHSARYTSYRWTAASLKSRLQPTGHSCTAADNVDVSTETKTLAKRSDKKVVVSSNSVRGRILVTGLGHMDEDEFALSLLNEQNVWDQILLGTSDLVLARKRLLSRSARYSGLLNLLDFTELTLPHPAEKGQEIFEKNEQQLKKSLDGVSTWLAYNVSSSQISSLAAVALALQIPRVVFTTQQTDEDTSMSAFTQLTQQFEEQGLKFTGIRHGKVIPGSEDVPYRIANGSATLPARSFVTRGVLTRIASELLNIDVSFNQECSLETCSMEKVLVGDDGHRFEEDKPDATSPEFAAAYLSILRSSGLSRQEEVYKIFTGGLQRVTTIMDEQYRLRAEKQAQKQVPREKGNATMSAEVEQRLYAKHQETLALRRDEDPSEDIDQYGERMVILPKALRIRDRTEEILDRVWTGLNRKMFHRHTSESFFKLHNKEKATLLAKKEIEEEDNLRIKESLRRRGAVEMSDAFLDAQRQQYGKLLALERKELLRVQQESLEAIKFVFILLEMTITACKSHSIVFSELDAMEQSVVLRVTAAAMRRRFALPHNDLLFDPLDASEVVRQMAELYPFMMKKDGVTVAMGFEEVYVLLMRKYGELLRSSKAMLGMRRIVRGSIKMLRQAAPSETSSFPTTLARPEQEQIPVASRELLR